MCRPGRPCASKLRQQAGARVGVTKTSSGSYDLSAVGVPAASPAASPTLDPSSYSYRGEPIQPEVIRGLLKSVDTSSGEAAIVGIGSGTTVAYCPKSGNLYISKSASSSNEVLLPDEEAKRWGSDQRSRMNLPWRDGAVIPHGEEVVTALRQRALDGRPLPVEAARTVLEGLGSITAADIDLIEANPGVPLEWLTAYSQASDDV